MQNRLMSVCAKQEREPNVFPIVDQVGFTLHRSSAERQIPRYTVHSTPLELRTGPSIKEAKRVRMVLPVNSQRHETDCI